MTKALLIIDYTNDFVDDKGALTCGKPELKSWKTILLKQLKIFIAMVIM